MDEEAGRHPERRIADMDIELELAQRDPAVLIGVVRRIVVEPESRLGRWSVERLLDGGSGADIARLSGVTGSGRPWSVIVKAIPPGGGTRRFWEECWRNEVDAYDSGFLGRLHHGVTAPRCFLVERRATRTWLWLEDLGGQEGSRSDTGTWIEVARRLGDFNAADLAGRIDRPRLGPSRLRRALDHMERSELIGDLDRSPAHSAESYLHALPGWLIEGLLGDP